MRRLTFEQFQPAANLNVREVEKIEKEFLDGQQLA